jgi:hypothetical protein
MTFVLRESGAVGSPLPLRERQRGLAPPHRLPPILLFSDNLRSDVVGVSRSGEGAASEVDTHHAPLPNPPRKGEGILPAAPLFLNKMSSTAIPILLRIHIAPCAILT